MPWTILEKLWKRSSQPLKITAADSTQTWDLEIKTLFQLGISMEDTLQYLYYEKPDFETFKNWIIKRQKKVVLENADLTENVLSEKVLEFWNENGYIDVKNAIS